MQHPIRRTVFYSPLALLLIGLVLSLISTEWFFAQARQTLDWLLNRFDWMFSWSTFFAVLLMIGIYVSPLGKVKIGGKNGQPLLSRWRWFAVTLCTTVATGILFWGPAEPIFHLISPPEGSGTDPAAFAMSTLLMHWTVTPYALYTIGSLTFAITYYNYKQPFTLSSMLYPILGEKAHGGVGQLADAICLFSLVAGMAASLGAGILTLDGGVGLYVDLPSGGISYAIICFAIVAAFLVSAATGLQRGIRRLSNWNAIGFILLSLFVLTFGPFRDMLSIAWLGIQDYVANFLPRSTNINNPLPTEWQHSWTIFYWAGWYAWAPITALFLGRLGVGYTVRQFIQTNMIIPVLFSAFWMIIFSGSSIALDNLQAGSFQQTLTNNGPESVVYLLLEQLPGAQVSAMIFLLVVFLSYVTAADSNISAMSALSVKGISPDNPEAPLYIRLIWGSLIGTVAWVMITFAGVDGIRLISTIGGFPAMLLITLVSFGLFKMGVASFRDRDVGKYRTVKR